MTILMHFNIRPNREKLLEKINYKKTDYNAYDIVKMSEVYGLKCSGIKASLNKIIKLPVIAHVTVSNNYFHFIVIYKIDQKRRKILVMDPAIGLKTISFNDFEKISTGIFLVFKKTHLVKSKNRLKKIFWEIITNNKKVIIKTIIISLLFVCTSLIFNYYLKIILTFNHNLSIIKTITLFFIIISFLKNSIYYIKNKLVLNLNMSIDNIITKKVIKHLLHLPYRYFNRKTNGQFVSIVSDLDSFKNCITNILILSFVDAFLVLIVLVYIYYLNFKLAIFLTLMLLLIYIITNRYKYVFNDSFIPYKVKNIDYNSNLIEVLNGMESIKNLNIENSFFNILERKYLSMKKKEKSYLKKIYQYDYLYSIFIDITYVILIVLGLYLVHKTNQDIYDLVLYSSLFYLIISFSKNILNGISIFKVEKSKINRVLDLLEHYESYNEDSCSYNLINEITFKEVSYKNILTNINLTLKKGEKVFITGPSGVGKSTLIKLLLNFFKISKGSILIDNINIKDYSTGFIKKKITYCSQNESIFKGTIKSNLEVVNYNKSLKEITKLTLLDKVIKEKGLDYRVGEFGNNLSGGERKKLILTRALLKMDEVLILDEVTNEISIEEESVILKNIFDKYKDKLIIVISHRTSNMNLFSKKYYLKGDDFIEIK